MKQQALGMIETKGLVPAIEAADAGVKAANVKLVGYEIVQGGLVLVAFLGDVAAVQASVGAGGAAAGRIGIVISEHVIPRPEADLGMVFKGKSALPKDDGPKPDREGNAPSPKNDEGKALVDFEIKAESVETTGQEVSDPGPETSISDSEVESGRGQESLGDGAELESMTVGELRGLARKTPGIAIDGREISRANKRQLINEILKARGRKD